MWAVKRGGLRVYLGAAPGVGKTFAMLEEGLRRHERGTRVVVGVVAHQSRAAIASRLAQLEAVTTTGSRPEDVLGELDVDAIVARRPAVVLVDDMAHRVGGDADHGRWHDIDVIRDAGIDVITTVGLENLESMKDVVASITGVVPTETLPDAIVRDADQIELVDMSPEALRRRLAHGNVYPPERVDTALANYFRPGNLAALRQLALLWVADDVDARLQDYVSAHHITDTWDVRERVVVALTGIGGEALVRRASRIAGRARGRLIGVHVVSGSRPPGPHLEVQRQLVAQLGGTYREVVGEDVAEALIGFARVEHATQLVLGANRSPRRRRLRLQSTIVGTLLERLGEVDVHVISTESDSGVDEPIHHRRPGGAEGIDPSLGLAAWATCIVGLPLLTFLLTRVRTHVSVGSALLLDLTVVLTVAALGGIVPGLVASFTAFALTLWFLTPPLHTLRVRDAQNVVALTVFIAMTIVVSWLVDRAARQSREAARARREAGALARSAATLVGAHDPLPELLEQLRATFSLDAAAVVE